MSNNLVQIWFSYTCQQLNEHSNACWFVNDPVKGSLTLIKSTSQSFSQSKHLHDNIQAAVSRRKSVVTILATEKVSSVANDKTAVIADISGKNYLVVAPLIINKKVVGAVGFQFRHRPQSKPNDYLVKVETSIAWLNCLFQLTPESDSTKAELALKVTALALSQSKSSEAALAVTTELANRLKCERVSIGFVKNDEVRLHSISNSSNHATHQDIVKNIESAMLEAVDQHETLLFPQDAKCYYSTQQHALLVRQHSGEYLCTVPLVVDENVIGAIMFERQGEAAEFDTKSKELCEQLATTIAPIFHLRRFVIGHRKMTHSGQNY